jgi:hypothetical protein
MKTLIFSCLLAVITPFTVFAQSKSTISIKTIKIENGDTIVTERSYNSDGDNIIMDGSIFNMDGPFIFFNNDYNLDTNFTEKFHETFSQEMKFFFNTFNGSPFDMPENAMELYKKNLPLNFDSVFSDKDFHQMIPDTTRNYRDKAKSQTRKPKRNDHISTENIILPNKMPVSEFSAEPGDEAGNVKIVFQLDPKRQRT